MCVTIIMRYIIMCALRPICTSCSCAISSLPCHLSWREEWNGNETNRGLERICHAMTYYIWYKSTVLLFEMRAIEHRRLFEVYRSFSYILWYLFTIKARKYIFAKYTNKFPFQMFPISKSTIFYFVQFLRMSQRFCFSHFSTKICKWPNVDM